MTDAAPPLALDRLLRPRSVAIVGASDKPGSLGASVLANLLRDGYDGDIYLVNPKRAEIGGRACVATVDDLPQGVDAAVLAIPRAGVLEAVRGLAARGAGSAVIFSAGFAEDGAEGLAEQQEIARIARASGMVIEGPNCLGLVNFADGIALSFVEMPRVTAIGVPRVGIVSQSGAMAAVLATTMIARQVPLGAFVSTGNEAASGIEDYLAHMAADPGTTVIGLIAEHIRRPRAFLSAARAARAAGKTVVLLHPGSSEAGRASAATHTGALAGDHDVMRAHVAAAGVLLVDTLEALGDVVEIALRCPGITARAVGMVAESGAYKALTLDLSERVGLALPVLTDADSPALRAAIPPFVPVSNPVDVTAQGLVDPSLYGRTISALAGDVRIDSIIVTLIQTDTHTSHVKFAAVAEAVEMLGTAKPLIVAGVDEGGGVLPEDIAALRAAGVPYLPTAERVVRALAAIGAGLDVVDGASAMATGLTDVQPGATIPEYRSKALLGAHGIAFPPHDLATSIAGATAVANRLGYPVVLKAQAAALSHKSDAGGVIVGIADDAALAAAWERMHRDVASARPGLVLDGLLVEKMGARGVELILGARNDPEWGATVLVGFGGVAAELLEDVVLLPPGLSIEAIEARIDTLRMAPLLRGFRGAVPADVRAVAVMAQRLGAIVAATPNIREVDLNPVIALPEGQGAVALDALISG
ncbi:acetate--CoA ligase family protein [Sphingomonas sp. TX0543]|uniref:acetate--CoA ligase family protein n=1 Tax=Sphingomonas sp. TX0543 TaxID=3399682 RepID=UPI003AFA9300